MDDLIHASTPSESVESQVEEPSAVQQEVVAVTPDVAEPTASPKVAEVRAPVAAAVPKEATASWEEQLEESLNASTIKRGELREGTILSRRSDGFVVDIGAKRDGFVPFEDLAEVHGREFNVGDLVPVVVARFRDSDGNVELSISQALLQEDWLIAERLLESQDVYESRVTGANRGGLTVEFGRLRGFVPMSQLIGFNRIRQPGERQRRLEAMVDEEILLKVIEVNRRRRRLILSQRAAAKEWRATRRQDLLEELEADQVRRGRISQITDFGLFVNLGGMDGLVHISELSWGRIENPSEVYHVGQRVKVKVLNIDRDRQRIALSIKALAPDPWESVVERYNIGRLVQGRVTQVVDFGVFIELEPGVEGLLHNSELRDVAQREDMVSGEAVLVKVIRVESDRRRIGLSVRQVRPEEWEEWALAQIAEEQVAPSEDDGDEDVEDDLDFGDVSTHPSADIGAGAAADEGLDDEDAEEDFGVDEGDNADEDVIDDVVEGDKISNVDSMESEG
ncbi:MAG: S1 RNA-binding domain-containing protein [Anaerolineae bacterium]|nr:S1 RNA-binding domain-containing protein [Anaerolineae bacterium]